EALGDGAARHVLDVGADLDPPQPPAIEAVVGEGGVGRRHHAPALARLVQPVADRGGAVGAVDGDADDAGKASAAEDTAAEATAFLLHPARAADEGMRVLRRLPARPVDPAREPRAISLDQRVQLL